MHEVALLMQAGRHQQFSSYSDHEPQRTEAHAACARSAGPCASAHNSEHTQVLRTAGYAATARVGTAACMVLQDRNSTHRKVACSARQQASARAIQKSVFHRSCSSPVCRDMCAQNRRACGPTSHLQAWLVHAWPLLQKQEGRCQDPRGFDRMQGAHANRARTCPK